MYLHMYAHTYIHNIMYNIIIHNENCRLIHSLSMCTLITQLLSMYTSHKIMLHEDEIPNSMKA